MKLLLTGATGFVGRHLSRHLLAGGHQVHAVVRSAAHGLKDVAGHIHDGTTENLAEIVAQTRPDVVIHLATLFIALHATKDVAPLIQSNVLFGTQLAEAMMLAKVTRLVNAGTVWQRFGGAAYSPVSLYAATKQALESMLAYYVECAGMKLVNLTLFDTYGPGDPRPKIISHLHHVSRTGETLPMSPGQQYLDLVHVDDVVRAFEITAQRLMDGKVERRESGVVSSGKPVKLRDIADLFSRVTGRKLNIEWGGRPYRPREIMEQLEIGQPLPGWAPKISLEEGIKRLEAENV